MAAAEAQFLDRGYWETTVEHIADAAKVSRATFYTYFRSKREALEAVGKVASDAADLVFDALAELPADWTTDDIADWIRGISSAKGCRRHGPSCGWKRLELIAMSWRPAERTAGITRERSAGTSGVLVATLRRIRSMTG